MTATATATLKMGENVNLRLEQHVNRALFYCLRLYSWHRFVDFCPIGNANDLKVHNLKFVTITEFTKLE